MEIDLLMNTFCVKGMLVAAYNFSVFCRLGLVIHVQNNWELS